MTGKLTKVVECPECTNMAAPAETTAEYWFTCSCGSRWYWSPAMYVDRWTQTWSWRKLTSISTKERKCVGKGFWFCVERIRLYEAVQG